MSRRWQLAGAGLGGLVLGLALVQGEAQAALPCTPVVWIEWIHNPAPGNDWEPFESWDTHAACERSVQGFNGRTPPSQLFHYCFPETFNPRPAVAGGRP